MEEWVSSNKYWVMFSRDRDISVRNITLSTSMCSVTSKPGHLSCKIWAKITIYFVFLQVFIWHFCEAKYQMEQLWIGLNSTIFWSFAVCNFTWKIWLSRVPAYVRKILLPSFGRSARTTKESVLSKFIYTFNNSEILTLFAIWGPYLLNCHLQTGCNRSTLAASNCNHISNSWNHWEWMPKTEQLNKRL